VVAVVVGTLVANRPVACRRSRASDSCSHQQPPKTLGIDDTVRRTSASTIPRRRPAHCGGGVARPSRRWPSWPAGTRPVPTPEASALGAGAGRWPVRRVAGRRSGTAQRGTSTRLRLHGPRRVRSPARAPSRHARAGVRYGRAGVAAGRSVSAVATSGRAGPRPRRCDHRRGRCAAGQQRQLGQAPVRTDTVGRSRHNGLARVVFLQAARPNSRTALVRRNFGHTSSRNGTCGMSAKIRSSVSPAGK
jgi:hypothetical protein